MIKILFKDFIKLQRGFDLPKSNFIDEAVPVIGSTSILGYHNEYKAKGPGVVMGRSGTLGKIQYIDKDFWPHNTTLWVKNFNGHEPLYVYYLLKNIDFTLYNSGGAVPSLNRNVLDNIEINILSINEQRKVKNILSRYDSLIENNLKRIKLLEESAELIYKEWFINFRFPEYEECEFVDGVPKGWENVQTKELGTVITGKTPSTKRKEYYGGNIQFIKTPDMSENVYVINTAQTLTEEGANSQANKFIPKNSILVSCIGTIGVVALTNEKAQFNQQINAIVPFNKKYIYYLYFKFKSLKELLEGLGSNGATMINVNKGKFEKINILKPDENIINQFYNKCDAIFKQMLNLQLSNDKLKEARDILIPKLINGEIEV